VYFAPGVTIQEQVIFANYIHAHLQARSEEVQRLRYYVCPHCGTPKGNPQVMMKKLLSKKKAADVECDICEKRFNLWDDLEILFASDACAKRSRVCKPSMPSDWIQDGKVSCLLRSSPGSPVPIRSASRSQALKTRGSIFN